MRNLKLMLALLICAGQGALSAAEPLVTLRTQTASFAVDAKGSLCALSRNEDGRDYLAATQPAPLLSVRMEGKLYAPQIATWDAATRHLALRYGDTGASALLTVDSKPTHVVFELVEVQPTNRVELVVWGPYPTTISNIIGETVGVVREKEFAVGLQALNAKTLGGYPVSDNDVEPDYGADDPGDYPALPAELTKGQGFRGDAARRTDYGSVVQAFCRNRDRERVIANWGHEKFVAPPFRDGGVVGSKIALFACPAGKALETIGAIELAEGLPHPMLDGVWAKQACNANCSYLIVDFSEDNIERAIEMTKRAGLNYLYHSSPFETWGHFELKRSLFPHGWDGFRACVEKAGKTGVRVGFHTLSNFITPNDAYVTPKPDPRLARIGSSVLTAEVDADQKEIPIASPDYFRKPTDMNTVVIGAELVRYGSVSGEAPWRLLDCRRGAWDTHAAAHAANSSVGKLMDHAYKVFLTDADLAQEVARNIAKLCNYTGARQISLDGLEGNWSTGCGQYGRTLFTEAWYDALSPELQGKVINDASNPGHFNWHIYTRMNWGEPWYAGFRESQTLYRFKNQVYFERNLMPHMLGWFALRPTTSLEDAEWLLARAAGFDAGFALAASLASTAQLEADAASADAARQFGATPAILAAIQQWETARMAGAFPASVKALLRDNSREFHLESAGMGQWRLYEVLGARFSQDASKPGPAEFQFTNTNAPQVLQWVVWCDAKQPVSGLKLELGGKQVVALGETTVPAGGALKYAGGAEAVICTEAWKEVGRMPVDRQAAQAGTGVVELKLGYVRQKDANLKLEVRTLGPAIAVGGKK
jgi:hypothetical protein